VDKLRTLTELDPETVELFACVAGAGLD
jgi:hypothetical protein